MHVKHYNDMKLHWFYSQPQLAFALTIKETKHIIIQDLKAWILKILI